MKKHGTALQTFGLSAIGYPEVADRRITIRRTPNEEEAKDGAKRI